MAAASRVSAKSRIQTSTHYPLFTTLSPPHFSTHFHSRINPITPRPTPSNLSTSATLIRIRPARSNKHSVNERRY
jgi:hypothetical protein